MAKQNRVTEARAEKSNRRQAGTAVVARLDTDLLGQVEQISRPIGAANGGSPQVQGALLDDGRLHSIQRRDLAAWVGQMQGNQHLQGVVTSLRQLDRTRQRPAASPGVAGISSVVQRRDEDEEEGEVMVFSPEEAGVESEEAGEEGEEVMVFSPEEAEAGEEGEEVMVFTPEEAEAGLTEEPETSPLDFARLEREHPRIAEQVERLSTEYRALIRDVDPMLSSADIYELPRLRRENSIQRRHRREVFSYENTVATRQLYDAAHLSVWIGYVHRALRALAPLLSALAARGGNDAIVVREHFDPWRERLLTEARELRETDYVRTGVEERREQRREAPTARPSADTRALAEQIAARVSGVGRITAPGILASQILDQLREARVTNDEMMDILQRLERGGEIAHFLAFVRFPWFREFLRTKGVSWQYVFANWEAGLNDCGAIFAGFVLGAGRSVTDAARLIGVLVGSIWSEELAQERDQFFSGIAQFFEHPIVTAERGLQQAYRTFVNHLWNLELFEAGESLGLAAVTVLTLPSAIRSIPQLARTIGRMSVRTLQTTLGVTRAALRRFARSGRPRMGLPEGQVLVSSGDDIVVVGSEGQTGRISREAVLSEAGEAAAVESTRPSAVPEPARPGAIPEPARPGMTPERARPRPVSEEGRTSSPLEGERTRVDVESQGVSEWPEGLVHHGLDRSGARASYRASIREIPTREAGIWRDPVTNEYLCVQGDRTFVDVDWMSEPQFLRGGRRVNWELVEHYHPATRPVHMVPSINDFRHVLHAMLYGEEPLRPIRSVIRYIDPETRVPLRVEFGYNPGAARPIWVRHRATGRWRTDTFRNVPWLHGSDYMDFLRRLERWRPGEWLEPAR